MSWVATFDLQALLTTPCSLVSELYYSPMTHGKRRSCEIVKCLLKNSQSVCSSGTVDKITYFFRPFFQIRPFHSKKILKNIYNKRTYLHYWLSLLLYWWLRNDIYVSIIIISTKMRLCKVFPWFKTSIENLKLDYLESVKSALLY